ncbi:MAG: aminotransferase class I/II-fold pyridoxal phosphate-dependent enzyme [candidate division Zixibacteria bacterium]|nr:aminotransferase class I/II-fold pyridoxal phosphate-dependent enzyme [candidate division Zixibacteria bacterium]
MPLDRFIPALAAEIEQIDSAKTAKANERIVTDMLRANGQRGPRFILKGYDNREFLRMNSNSYLGMSAREVVTKAEEATVQKFGAGPGAVRFISGTYDVHVRLEKRLAQFHGREDCMITSAAYTSVLGVIVSLTTSETIILSDELNHNCIINAMKLARPKDKQVYRHLDMDDLEEQIIAAEGQCDSLLLITDGVFSMRGVYAPLDRISAIVAKHNHLFPRGIVLIVDDSHGVGALGETGRGTEELCKAKGVDILVATLGKAFGVNGGYIVSRKEVIRYLREKNPLYIYTNPITQGEASAALASIDFADSPAGREVMKHLHHLVSLFEKGLVDMGYETLPSPHPVTPLMVRDTAKTTRLVQYLFDNNILATGLNYPVVPKGDELIRFQVNGDHTESDLKYVLDVLGKFRNEQG